MGTPETLSRRERRRRQAVRGFLLDSLRELDGVEYMRADAPETLEDAPWPRFVDSWDAGNPQGDCRACGRRDALAHGYCRACDAEASRD